MATGSVGQPSDVEAGVSLLSVAAVGQPDIVEAGASTATGAEAGTVVFVR
jgi:hypothetical protein